MIASLSVVLPVYNERTRICASLTHVLDYLDRNVPKFEVLVVDDGSGDGTADLVRAEFGERVRVLVQPRNRGKGAAVRAGVAAARCAWILVVDADLAIPIETFPELAVHADDAPIVIGSKRMARSQVRRALVRRVAGGVAQVLIAVLVVRGIRDTQCGFKLFRTDVAHGLFRAQRIDGFGFDFEILYLARRYGIAVREVPVRGDDFGGGSVRVSAYVRTLVEALRVAWYRAARRYPGRMP